MILVGDMLFGRYVWSPNIYVVVCFIFAWWYVILVDMFGKRQMEATVVNEVMM